MMYCEFVTATGCKDTEYNYNVFKDLEVMYTHSDLTKEKIYEYGMKLVDNSETEEERKFREKIEQEVLMVKSDIDLEKYMVNSYRMDKELWSDEKSSSSYKDACDGLKRHQKNLREAKQKLQSYKTLFPQYC